MLYVVTGPPAAGKSTWVRQHARHGDITIDYDTLAAAITPPGDNAHDHPRHIKAVTRSARQAAIDTALTLCADVDVYLIHTQPSPDLLATYAQLGAEIVTVDPGIDTTLARARTERPTSTSGAVKQWYRTGADQRSEARKLRSSRAWRTAAAEYKEVCRRHRNADGTLGAHCAHCGQPIDYDAPKDSPSAFEADHHKPLHTHPQLAFTRSNLRPSHKSCNGSKGAKAPTPQGAWVPANF